MGIFCLEGEWDKDLRVRDSVVPSLELLDRLGVARYIHRDVATRDELVYYLTEWTKKKYAKYEVLYLAMHGDEGGVSLGRDEVTLKEIADLLKGRCAGRTIHFGSCLVLGASDAELKRFIATTGAVAVTGYETRVDWIASAAFEVLLLDRLVQGGRGGTVYRHLHRDHGQFATQLGLVAATATRVYRGVEPAD